MSTERRATWTLLLIAPILAELLSGSSPPLRFFHPVGLPALIALYGGGALMIREARVRWGLQWQVALLALAFGVLEEGTAIQSFFNHNHVDLHAMSRYGLFLGVQWPWSLMVSFFHATISTLIPIAIVDALFPQLRSTPLLGPRGLRSTAAAMGLVIVLFWLLVWGSQRGSADPYHPRVLLLIASALVVAGLVGLASHWRRHRLLASAVPLAPPALLGVAAFLTQGLNLIVPKALVDNGAPAGVTVALQLIGLALVLVVARLQLLHRDLTTRHLAAVVTGSLLFFITMTPAQELGGTDNPDPTTGMLAVGAMTLAALIWWRRRAMALSR